VRRRGQASLEDDHDNPSSGDRSARHADGIIRGTAVDLDDNLSADHDAPGSDEDASSKDP
jgi:hypothetical protein